MMVSEELDVTEWPGFDPELALAEYRRRQMIEHMVGPLVSLVLHVILIVAAFLFITGEYRERASEIEVSIEDMEIKELEDKVLEELQELEQIAEDVVPAVEKPDVPQEVAEVATDDFSDDMAQTDDALDFSSVLDIRATDTPLKLPGLYGGRSDEGRKKQLNQFGGNPATENAVLRALRWLKKTQNADGSWSKSEPQAMCGLALLAFLAHGETPVSKEFGTTVQKAMQYLSDQMMAVPESQAAGLKRAYTNGICTYALSEAYGLTKIPFLRPPMERGLGFIVRGQQPNGGYDYRYRKGNRWDLSVAGWQVQAMKAGYVAGANVDGLHEAIDKSVEFLRKTTFRNGRFGYSSPGVDRKGGMQGVGALCLQLVGEGKCSEARSGVKQIVERHPMVWEDNRSFEPHHYPPYNWYYQTQAIFHAGRSYWRDWNEVFSHTLVRHQKRDGHWDCPGNGKMPEYDPWYATTLNCLSLQVYYRYLPTYKMPKRIAKRKPSILEELDEDLGLELE